METIAVSELRANLTGVLKRIESGESVTVTARGRAIARLVPPENSRERARAALKQLRKTAIVGDVMSPLGEQWKAMT